ncbi:MAG TPA: hypothetical protein PKI46_07615 [Bacteroidales bacterium]|nr:hypothetical protein [Bacteroidales bacterium]
MGNSKTKETPKYIIINEEVEDTEDKDKAFREREEAFYKAEKALEIFNNEGGESNYNTYIKFRNAYYIAYDKYEKLK